MKVRNKRIFESFLMVSLLLGATLLGGNSSLQAEETHSLLITEIAPNIQGPEDYEYFEVHNASSEKVDLEDYSFQYVYTDGTLGDIPLSVPNYTIDSKQTVVLWFNKTGAATESFREHFPSTNENTRIIEFTGEGFTGMSNGGNRGIKIIDANQGLVSSANYLKEEVSEDLSKHFQLQSGRTEMTTYQTSSAVTPGDIHAEQVTIPSDDNPAPAITHTPVTTVNGSQNLTIQTKIEDDQDLITATLHYQTHPQLNWHAVPLTTVDQANYSAEIPYEQLLGESLRYYIEVNDGTNTVTAPEDKTEPYSVSVAPEELADSQSVPKLLLTEVTPDTVNVGGSDGYEFIEGYNNTSQPINLKDYQILYRYPSSSQLEWDLTEDLTIGPQQPFTIWIKNGANDHLTIDDFNENYGTSLTKEELTTVSADGMANGSQRSIILADDLGTELSFGTYNAKERDTAENQGITYKYPNTGSSMVKTGTAPLATPGTLLNGQAPPEPVKVSDDTEAPSITHEGAATAQSGRDLRIEAQVTDNKEVNTVALSYKNVDAEEWLRLEMKAVKEKADHYETVIPAKNTRTGDIGYKIEATDGVNVAETDTYTVEVKPAEYDAQKLPPLLITEVVPDSSNVNGLDGYEYVEVYNNSSRDIDFKDYKLRYRYPMEGPAADLLWSPEQKNVIIPSGQSIVFWIKNTANQDKTADDFNGNYDTELDIGKNLFTIQSNGMSNSGHRGLVVATNTGHEIITTEYNDEANKKDPASNKGIVYAFPTDGSNQMVKVSSAVKDATPSATEPYQTPDRLLETTEDKEKPVLEDLTNIEEVNEKDNLQLRFDAKDNTEVKTVTLYYKNNVQKDFNKVDLQQDYDDGFYHHTIYPPDMIGKEEIEYYLEVSDGTNTIRTNKETVQIIGNEQLTGLRLNVEDEKILTGETLLKATSSSENYDQIELSIDGRSVTSETYRSLEQPAYFAFDVKKTNLYFKNGVTMNSESLLIFDDTINTYQTMTVPIEPTDISYGESTKIAIRSGTKVSPFDEESEENRDDFYVKNVRMVLSDGTVIYDPQYKNPDQELSIGDGGSSIPTIEFSFDLPEEPFISKTYKWDTTAFEEGNHTIETSDGEDTKQASVIVDNSPPVVTASVDESTEYKGEFVIDADIEDQWSGVTEVTALLDGETIELPYQTSSAKLTPGQHSFEVTATDLIGNQIQEQVTFTVVEEHPYQPEVLSPEDGSEDVKTNAPLSVKVSDPTADDMLVDFFEGAEYEPGDSEVQVFSNSSTTEPPGELSSNGDQLLMEKDVEKITSNDQTYFTTSSIEEFPYHRFEVEVGQELKDRDRVELNWEGKSLPGRKVSMYVWNFSTKTWDLKQWKVAGEQDFDLKAEITDMSYISEGKVQVLVQDEIAEVTPFDYTMVWMSDTQYYSESYPHIYKDMVDWVAGNQEKLNIPYVFHTGDLVDEWDDEQQWNYADAYMNVLEGANIPYGVLAGNHDVNQKDNDYSQYSKYFGSSRFESNPTYGGSYKDNRGHYDLVSVNGTDFLMVYMGWGVTQEDLDWMNSILAQYPDRLAFLSFHEYLLVSGNRSPLGEDIYKQVVEPNENVAAVLSGHYHDSETLVDEIDDDGDGTADRKVYQMLADYQGGPEGGQGYLRLLHVNSNENKIYVKTYSPYLDDYNYYDADTYPGKDEFIIDLPLQPKEKQVATDAFEVNVFTDVEIGKARTAKSDHKAKVLWKHLDEKTEYSWYVKVSDQYGGETISPVWSFTTETKNNKEDDVSEKERKKDEVKPLKVKEKKGKWEIKLPNTLKNENIKEESINIRSETGERVEGTSLLNKNGKTIVFLPDHPVSKEDAYLLSVTGLGEELVFELDF
ncbi:lamin tail domain-containing protein [Halobacillus sp. GSS1]|uniref:lamin tail domain-containing protein n=1 Tax=Halobacillus sp. GSS1 TaxID=2815919 RepID=UPI001A8C54AB|nr:lamin tail domain-containing protein [Halobacillus sp. GSS1]MBN9654044.1 lamin tail domain-containing protein [Halobacillus sp. GSS1]